MTSFQSTGPPRSNRSNNPPRIVPHKKGSPFPTNSGQTLLSLVGVIGVATVASLLSHLWTKHRLLKVNKYTASEWQKIVEVFEVAQEHLNVAMHHHQAKRYNIALQNANIALVNASLVQKWLKNKQDLQHVDIDSIVLQARRLVLALSAKVQDVVANGCSQNAMNMLTSVTKNNSGSPLTPSASPIVIEENQDPSMHDNMADPLAPPAILSDASFEPPPPRVTPKRTRRATRQANAAMGTLDDPLPARF